MSAAIAELSALALVAAIGSQKGPIGPHGDGLWPGPAGGLCHRHRRRRNASAGGGAYARRICPRHHRGADPAARGSTGRSARSSARWPAGYSGRRRRASRRAASPWRCRASSRRIIWARRRQSRGRVARSGPGSTFRSPRKQRQLRRARRIALRRGKGARCSPIFRSAYASASASCQRPVVPGLQRRRRRGRPPAVPLVDGSREPSARGPGALSRLGRSDRALAAEVAGGRTGPRPPPPRSCFMLAEAGSPPRNYGSIAMPPTSAGWSPACIGILDPGLSCSVAASASNPLLLPEVAAGRAGTDLGDRNRRQRARPDRHGARRHAASRRLWPRLDPRRGPPPGGRAAAPAAPLKLLSATRFQFRVGLPVAERDVGEAGGVLHLADDHLHRHDVRRSRRRCRCRGRHGDDREIGCRAMSVAAGDQHRRTAERRRHPRRSALRGHRRRR